MSAGELSACLLDLLWAAGGGIGLRELRAEGADIVLVLDGGPNLEECPVFRLTVQEDRETPPVTLPDWPYLRHNPPPQD